LLRPVGVIDCAHFLRFTPVVIVHIYTTWIMFASSIRSTSSAMLRTSTAYSKSFPSLVVSSSATTTSIRTMAAAKVGQAEVVLVGCGAPNRGMGWYHAIQMLEGRYVRSHYLNFYTHTHCALRILFVWMLLFLFDWINLSHGGGAMINVKFSRDVATTKGDILHALSSSDDWLCVYINRTKRQAVVIRTRLEVRCCILVVQLVAGRRVLFLFILLKWWCNSNIIYFTFYFSILLTLYISTLTHYNITWTI
jgi:hypothetical protein